MSDDAVFAHLPELTAQLGLEHIQALLDRIEVVELEVGALLMCDQGPVDAFYLLLEGELALSVEVNGREIQLGTLRPGNWVGEVSYFAGQPLACATVRAATAVKLGRLNYRDFDALLAEDSIAACRLVHGFVLMLLRRLRATAGDPVLEPDGQLYLHGDPSVAWNDLAEQEQSLAGFLRRLLGLA